VYITGFGLLAAETHRLGGVRDRLRRVQAGRARRGRIVTIPVFVGMIIVIGVDVLAGATILVHEHDRGVREHDRVIRLTGTLMGTPQRQGSWTAFRRVRACAACFAGSLPHGSS
jgi:hypothetical protein